MIQIRILMCKRWNWTRWQKLYFNYPSTKEYVFCNNIICFNSSPYLRNIFTCVSNSHRMWSNIKYKWTNFICKKTRPLSTQWLFKQIKILKTVWHYMASKKMQSPSPAGLMVRPLTTRGPMSTSWVSPRIPPYGACELYLFSHRLLCSIAVVNFLFL